jgi:hypothetical protein
MMDETLNPNETPVAWMRRWAFDQVEVMKLPKKERPPGWWLHAVTETKQLHSDVPLYAKEVRTVRAV